ncbi:uncharacterized protein [Spinacia oleracea]|uniref:Reverse transcriptase domain-containing protein n=1 Tax=Spinacia oleracea TaxID=3562 RepID=A0A9R0IXV4_SPIOL|nr:uncharacterized protein LOC110796874 [Spinacia oleracea]
MPKVGKKRRSYKIEGWCLNFEQVKDIIKNGWGMDMQGSPMYSCSRKLQQIKYALAGWCREFKMNNNIIWDDVVRKCLKSQQDMEVTDIEDNSKLRRESFHEAMIKLAYWKQRAKGKWLALGDSNTSFFFRCAKSRKTRNEIKFIQDKNGNWISDQDEIKQDINQHFQELFKANTQCLGRIEIPEHLRDLPCKLTDEHIQILNKPFTEGEVRDAVFQIGGLKAPGPDGVPAIFLQKAWDVVGNDITKAVLHFFSSGYMLKEWNHTHIALIPKVNCPEKASQFRPISLCNVIYKVVSKCLTNRLKQLMNDLVGPYQNAFVPKRLMGDNCLLAHEIMTYIKKQKKGYNRYAILKIDMNKAYDRVSWDFIEWLLDAMRFPAQWRHWLLQCISTVSYSILVNGEPTVVFKPKCGIRQGDPISPYIFILVMEMLSKMMVCLEKEGHITGIKIARGSPSISHLLFADDSLFCFKADNYSCLKIRETIDLFCSISGEAINFEKSSVIFSPNTPGPLKNVLKGILGTPSADSLGKYLGCNVEVDGRSSQAYQPLIEKVQRKITSWKYMHLSHAGRIILINSILAALCTNILAVFLLPKSITTRITLMLMHYWWKGTMEKRGVCWVKRAVLEKPKGMGGIGLRNLELYNKAFLMKQAVRIHQNPKLLVAQVMTSAYKKTPLEAGLENSVKQKTSWGFKGMVRSVQSMKEGFGKVIAAGNSLISHCYWVPSREIKLKNNHVQNESRPVRISDLFCNNSRDWNSCLIWKTFEKSSAKEILNTYISKDAHEDKIHWVGFHNGSSSVKSFYAYQIICNLEGKKAAIQDRFWKKLWSSRMLPKWKMFIWRCLNKALPLKDGLKKRKIVHDSNCVFCQQQSETVHHLFRDCWLAELMWRSSHLGICSVSASCIPVTVWVKNFMLFMWKEDGHDSPRVRMFVAVLWGIWIQRNNIQFRKEKLCPTRLLEWIRQTFEESEKALFIKYGPHNLDNSERRTHSARIEDKVVWLVGKSSIDSDVLVVDGAWKRRTASGDNAAAIGWCLIHNSDIIKEGGNQVRAHTALQAEALAMLEGLAQAAANGVANIIVKTDSSNLVSALKSFPACPIEKVGVCHDILSTARLFRNCCIRKCPRDSVSCAHAIAVRNRL